jgi:hypothetical protein
MCIVVILYILKKSKDHNMHNNLPQLSAFTLGIVDEVIFKHPKIPKIVQKILETFHQCDNPSDSQS